MNSLIEQIQSCQYLYMSEIGEPRDNELRIVILEAKSGAIGERKAEDEKDEVLKRILETCAPIEHRVGCRMFELFWPNYVGYSVRNESYAQSDEYEKFDGRLLVEYSRSRCLDFLSKATFADSTYPGPLKHWGIFCLNHIIDVVSTFEPEVKMSTYA